MEVAAKTPTTTSTATPVKETYVPVDGDDKPRAPTFDGEHSLDGIRPCTARDGAYKIPVETRMAAVAETTCVYAPHGFLTGGYSAKRPGLPWLQKLGRGCVWFETRYCSMRDTCEMQENCLTEAFIAIPPEGGTGERGGRNAPGFGLGSRRKLQALSKL